MNAQPVFTLAISAGGVALSAPAVPPVAVGVAFVTLAAAAAAAVVIVASRSS